MDWLRWWISVISARTTWGDRWGICRCISIMVRIILCMRFTAFCSMKWGIRSSVGQRSSHVGFRGMLLVKLLNKYGVECFYLFIYVFSWFNGVGKWKYDFSPFFSRVVSEWFLIVNKKDDYSIVIVHVFKTATFTVWFICKTCRLWICVWK